MPEARPITRSRASSVAPTETSAARSARLRPCSAVTFAALVCALAAWRVLLAAVERVRRAVVFDGDLAAVVRAVPRDVLLRAVLLRTVLLRAVDRLVDLVPEPLVEALVVVLDVVVVAMSCDQ